MIHCNRCVAKARLIPFCVSEWLVGDRGCCSGSRVPSGHIELHPLCCRIVDTPEFQRLRDLKQLGGLYFVYPTASHNRFEHSIGVCHLAGRLIDHLAERQPYLGITPTEKLCVRIAGLIHDLGHGPLSHMFDEHVVRRLNDGCTWSHEDASIDMLDYMLEEGLRGEFERWGIGEREVGWIRGMVTGEATEDVRDKQFLFEIVANKRNGVDVDRMDYFARDSRQLGLSESFDSHRLMLFTRACSIDRSGDERHLAFKSNEAVNLREFAHTRFMLHKRGYQHRVGRSVELLLTDVLVAAADYVPVRLPEDKSRGLRAETVPLADCHRNMRAYACLTDSLLWRIAHSHEPELAPSRRLMHRLHTRKLYKCVGDMLLPTAEAGRATQAGGEGDAWKEEINKYRTSDGKWDSEKFLDRLCDIAEGRFRYRVLRDSTDCCNRGEMDDGDCSDSLSSPSQVVLRRSDLLVDSPRLHFGMGDQDPMHQMDFYDDDPYDRLVPPNEGHVAATEDAPPIAKRLVLDQVSRAAPTEFQEEWLRVFCHREQPMLQSVWSKVLEAWAEETKSGGRMRTPQRVTTARRRPELPPPEPLLLGADGETPPDGSAAVGARRKLEGCGQRNEDEGDERLEPASKRPRRHRSDRLPLRKPPAGNGN